VPGLRMVAVCGPRIAPSALSASGAEVHGYVDDLHRWLAACDIGVVHGGLTTTMELVAARRPFLYFPLERHFEQQLHVAHRLERRGAGRRMDCAGTTPEAIAEAIAHELGHHVVPARIPTRGAASAAALISQLLAER
jgi:UDP-N-acetylglucosamine:LPS N-acetylglucosamine transferase